MAVSFVNKPKASPAAAAALTPETALAAAVAAEQPEQVAPPPGYKFVPNPAGGAPVLVPDKGAKAAASKPKAVQAAAQVSAPVAAPAVAAAQPKPLVSVKAKSEAVAAAEELITLEKAIVELKARELMSRYDELKKQLQSIATESGANPASEFTFTTDIGTVTFSAAKSETVVTDKDGMLELLGAETAAAIAKYNLTDIKKYLSGEQLSMVTETTPTGSRTLKAVVPKA